MPPVVIGTMISVAIGFILFGTSFVLSVYKKPKKWVWGCFIVAIGFITIIPTTLAIMVAAG